ncbi:transmembrane secretion effector [Actinomycetospora succinea]|uniref:Transmembrane secretion effector n=1 Tax=Actinomycetospora succinea TaxID=663603 RepID=A0A4R6VGY8_9PSEU|nr:MFS transporter [Actinomycetospora succinea]TDQ60566.1 transmembrane secretion effector [Actinomycetospora succinea]
MVRIDEQPSATHRIRGVLAIRPFRRLWAVTAVASFGDWLSLLALTALATQLTSGYQAQSFALGGVVATKLLPALFMAPLGGVLADKFDRRTVMVTCDVLKALLFLSIPLVGSLWWLFAATFLIELCALCWIPAKDSSVPNLLKRPDQVETANQLSLGMTYGVAVISAAGVFALISKSGAVLGWHPSPTATVYLALVVNGLAALLTAATVAFRIPEISGRSAERRAAAPGLLAMLRDGAQFVSTTPLVRGLVVGIVGAFAAGGAVIASARLYATSLGGGDAAYSVLFIALFTGLALGMALVPRFSRRIPHHRLFGVAIVGAGTSLLAVAVAWHLYLALAAVVLVGVFAGTALLTGLTIIGAQVEDAVRGRVVAFVQSIVRVDLLASMSVVPLLVGLVQSRTLTLFGETGQVDGTRFVLFGAGLLAAAVGVLAYHQMNDRLPAAERAQA